MGLTYEWGVSAWCSVRSSIRPSRKTPRELISRTSARRCYPFRLQPRPSVTWPFFTMMWMGGDGLDRVFFDAGRGIDRSELSPADSVVVWRKRQHLDFIVHRRNAFD